MICFYDFHFLHLFIVEFNKIHMYCWFTIGFRFVNERYSLFLPLFQSVLRLLCGIFVRPWFLYNENLRLISSLPTQSKLLNRMNEWNQIEYKSASSFFLFDWIIPCFFSFAMMFRLSFTRFSRRNMYVYFPKNMKCFHFGFTFTSTVSMNKAKS